MVDGFPSGEGCKVLDGEVNDEEWGKNDNKILPFDKIGGHFKV